MAIAVFDAHLVLGGAMLPALHWAGQVTWAFSPRGTSAAKAEDKSGLIAGLDPSIGSAKRGNPALFETVISSGAGS